MNLIKITLFTSTLFLWGKANSLPRVSASLIQPACSLKNSDFESIENLVHRVTIRRVPVDERRDQADQRKACSEEWCKATQKLFCRLADGSLAVVGSANKVGENTFATIAHVIFDAETCESTIGDSGRCYLKVDGKEIKFSLDQEFYKNQCRSNRRKDEDFRDFPIVFSTSDDSSSIPKYELLSREEAIQLMPEKVSVVGGFATNSEEIPPSVEMPQLVSEGLAYHYDFQRNKIHYDNDTGPGTSGGAVVIEKEGKRFLIGIHEGDFGQPEDGEDANPSYNYGIGHLFLNP